MNEVELLFIENKNKQKCVNCKFFIPNNDECSIFGEVDIVTNEYTFEDAIDVRNDVNKCGDDAIFFKKNNFKFVTIPYYFLLEHKNTIILSFNIVCFPFILVYLVTL